jgi:hypothetical protein
MTAKANHATPATRCPAPVVLFGIDSHGKPKGARFGKDHADLANKAASQLQLRVLASNDPKVADLATQLPVGRVHATGRTFVPFIRRDLYDKLIAAAPNGNAHPTSTLAGGGPGAAGMGAPGGSSPNLPKTWQEIGVGDLVVAQEGPEDGWYEAIVAEVNGDMLTLRWRDYPRERKIVRHRQRLGLLYPGLKPTSDTAKTRRRQKIKIQLPPPLLPPAHNRFREIGSRSTSVNLYWPNQKGRGRRGGRPFRSRKLAMDSSCAGGMGSTSRRALVHGSSWH